MIEKNISIGGMHCVNCAETIQANIAKIPGIHTANVQFTTEEATISFDDSKFDSNQMVQRTIQAIENAGYKAYPPDVSPEDKIKEANREFMKSIVSVALAFSIMGLSMGFNHQPPVAAKWIECILTIVIFFLVGRPFFKGAIAAVKQGTSNMDVLVSLGTSAAFVVSFADLIATQFFGFSLLSGSFAAAASDMGDAIHAFSLDYFETAAFLMAFVSFGKGLEAKTRAKTSSSIQSLLKLAPTTARVVRETEQVVPITEVVPGDKITVFAGERIPVDGIVIDSESDVDESMMTGESILVHKVSSSKVIAGTVNLDSTLILKSTSGGLDTTLVKMIKIVRAAQNSKPPIQKIADQISRIFVPSVIILSCATFAVWFFTGHSWIEALYPALSVLIISCPCALGLATPTAIVMGLQLASKAGILLKKAETIEQLSNAGAIAFDKTGTLTEGKPAILHADFSNQDNAIHKDSHELNMDWLQVLFTLSSSSKHPYSNAITDYLLNEKVSDHESDRAKLKKIYTLRVKTIPGKGTESEIPKSMLSKISAMLGTNIDPDSKWYARLGSVHFVNVAEIGQNKSESKKTDDHTATIVLFGITDLKRSHVLAAFELEDKIREDSMGVIQELQNLNMQVILLSGDREGACKKVADLLHISNYLAELTPEHKHDEITKIKKNLHKGKRLIMVGDGVNDAIALTEADVGVAMGSGTDIAIESAQVTLIKPTPRGVLKAILISKQTMRVVRQNLFFSFFYNIAGIPIAAGILYPWTGTLLEPRFAGLAMTFSSIMVVLNSVRLGQFRV